jgi:hypothetical protein
MIREERDDTPISVTIKDISENGEMDVGYANFRFARFDTSSIVIWEHNSIYYYPLALEYRLIDNNILYLIKELQLNSISEIIHILESSMEKEEGWTNKFKLFVCHLNNPPTHSYQLNHDFSVESIDTHHIYETNTKI